jgi:hypothetical protein
MTAHPKPTVDLAAIAGRHRAITDAHTTDGLRNALLDSAADVPALLAELARLRLQYADLRAAAQAAVSAERDHEPDPLAYLIDQLSGQWPSGRPSTEDNR